MTPPVLNLLSKGQRCPQKLEMKIIFEVAPSWNSFSEDFIFYVGWSRLPVLSFPAKWMVFMWHHRFPFAFGTQCHSPTCVQYFYLTIIDFILLVGMNLRYTDIMYILNTDDFLLYNFTHTILLMNYICKAFSKRK